MPTDQKLSDLDIPAALLRKLDNLAITSARQLYARLRHEDHVLQDYLQISDEDFGDFYRRVEEAVEAEHPEDTLPRVRPSVNKSGVAVHRLHDPARPKYRTRGGK